MSTAEDRMREAVRDISTGAMLAPLDDLVEAATTSEELEELENFCAALSDDVQQIWGRVRERHDLLEQAKAN